MKTLKEILIAEATEHDFKMMLEEKNPTSWLKSVSAFANGFGGSLYFGVSDDGTAVGLSDAQYTADKISEFILARIEPSLLYSLEPMLIENAEILRLVVESGKNKPYYVKSGDNRTAYYRSGNESVKAADRILSELILEGSNRTFDVLNSNHILTDHSFTLLNSAIVKNNGKRLSIPEDLISFGLLGDENRLTNAGALFADYCPVYNSRIFCTRWSGLSKGAGLIDALDDIEFSANVLMLEQNGTDFMKKHNRVMWNVAGMKRDNYPDYPQDALREALINALIHRDYITMGSEIHISIYDDRIEITSPGGMYGNKPIQDLDLSSVPSKRRNPVIADVFQRVDYAERRGTGLGKILNGYRNSERKPKFYSDESMFRTTLYNLNYGTERDKYANGIINGTNVPMDDSMDVPDNGTNGTNLGTSGTSGTDVQDNVQDNVLENVQDNVLENKRFVRHRKLLDLLKNDGAITHEKLSAELRVSVKTIQRDLGTLKKQECIERIGSDTSGYWKVIEKVGGTDE